MALNSVQVKDSRKFVELLLFHILIKDIICSQETGFIQIDEGEDVCRTGRGNFEMQKNEGVLNGDTRS